MMMNNDMLPQHDGPDSFLYPGEEHHYASGNLKTQPSYPGEEHYYTSGKLKTQPSYPGEEHHYTSGKLKTQPFYRRHAWQISTAVLAVVVVLLLFNTSRTLKQPAAATSQLQAPTSIGLTSVFTAGSTWQGTYYQHDYVGNYQTPMILRIDNIQGTTFSGTITESALDKAVTTTKGSIVNINSLGYLDKERLQEVINEYGSTGTLIIYTNPYQLNGNNIFLDSHFYALVSQDGVLHGIDFDPHHDPRHLRPDGVFTLYKEG